MKVCLIDPQTECNTNVLNVGLAYIGASLKQLKHEVTVADMARVPGCDLRKKCSDVDMVGVSVKTQTYRHAQEVTRTVKSDIRRPVTVWGGPHVTLLNESLIDENPEVDHFIAGEGEFFTEYLGGKLSHRALTEDLDTLPFPDYTIFDSYPQLLSVGSYPFIATRGCPCNCSFCSVPLVSGRRVRRRSVANCMLEIQQAVNRGFNRIQVLDDNFTFDVDAAKEFCRAIKTLNISWYDPNGIRADRFDDELARLMRESHCDLISFGVESGDPDVYKQIGKGECLEDIERSVEIAQKHGLFVNCYFIIGLPGSTFEKDLTSLKWAIAHKVKADFNMMVPYPGTRLWSWAQDKLIDKQRVGAHFGKLVYPIFETEQYKAQAMMDAFLIFNHVSGSGYTKEWYTATGIDPASDLMRRANRHAQSLEKAGIMRRQ
jgi:radical SAM superfamily enzyme YgiQ (UPF0313 family)